jgi:hypothetical protein
MFRLPVALPAADTELAPAASTELASAADVAVLDDAMEVLPPVAFLRCQHAARSSRLDRSQCVQMLYALQKERTGKKAAAVSMKTKPNEMCVSTQAGLGEQCEKGLLSDQKKENGGNDDSREICKGCLIYSGRCSMISE